MKAKRPRIDALLDPDLAGALPALERAAAAARKLSIETGTPFYVLKNGKIVDLNAAKPKNGGRKRRRR
jgi:hypothetical protein